MNQEEILNFIATLDHRLLAAAAVLLLLFLLFWRVFRRTTRIEREVAGLHERLERIREEVRSISRPGSVTVVPAKEATVADEEVTPAPSEVPDLVATQPEEEDVLSRAVASLAAANADEGLDTTENEASFSFDQSFDPESEEIAADMDESTVPSDEQHFSFGEPEEAPVAFEEPAVEEPAVEEPAVEEPAAPVVDEPESSAAAEEASSGVVSLEGDPARPGVSMVRCLSCNYKLAYPEKLAGKRVRCPSCRTGLDLP